MPDCSHENTPWPERPIPDHWARCPGCREYVAKRGGRWITVRENNARVEAHSAWRNLATDPANFPVLREAVWHAVQRGDIPDADRARLHTLYEGLAAMGEKRSP